MYLHSVYNQLCINSLPLNKMVGWSLLKMFEDYKLNILQNMKFILQNVEKLTGKKMNFCLPTFSPFSYNLLTFFFPHSVLACLFQGIKVEPLPDNKILKRSKLKQIADDILKCI